jgi:hypothetical protein
MSAHRDHSPWQDPAERPDRDELLAPQTQVVADRDAYLGQGRHDVGRRISDDQIELFASTDPASALQLELEQHQPRFIAVQDVGANAALRLLTSLASASGVRVQRLTVRKQGHGVALAVLQFIEVRIADGAQVRVYACDAGDAKLQPSLTRVLLAHSSLGVLLIGGITSEAIAQQLDPLHGAIQHGRWPNRELLMVPLGAGVALASHAAHLASGSSVAVHVTPRAARTLQAWTYIAGAWNRLHGGVGEHAMPAEFGPAGKPTPRPAVPRSEATTEPMGLHPVAAATGTDAGAGARPAAVAANTVKPWQVYADNCVLLKGAIACAVFDTLSLQVLAHAGSAGSAPVLAEQGAKLLRSMVEATRALGMGASPTDGAVSTSDRHLLIRPVQGHPGTALHMVLSSGVNLTLARMQLERIVPPKLK